MARIKLPIFNTCVDAFRFFFTHSPSVLMVGWFSILLLSALTVWQLLLTPGPNVIASDPTDLGKIMAINLLVLFVITPIVQVGLLKIYFAQYQRVPPYYFHIGGKEFRLIIATIIFVLTLVFVIAVLSGVLGATLYGILSVTSGEMPDFEAIANGAEVNFQMNSPLIGVTVFIGLLLIFGAALIIVMRLLLIPAVVVAEKRIGLGRTFAMTRGNGLRILLSYLLLIGFGMLILEGFLASLNYLSLDLPNIILQPTFAGQDVDFLYLFKAGFVIFFYQYVLLGLMTGYLGAAYERLKENT